MPVLDEADTPTDIQDQNVQATEGGLSGSEMSPECEPNTSHVIIGVVVVDFVRVDAS